MVSRRRKPLASEPTPPMDMTATATRQPGTDSEIAVEAIRENLRKLERRDWWLWFAAIVVMLLLTAAVVSLSFPRLFSDDPFFQYSLDQSVRGLVGLVLLLNTYSIYQQVTIKRLRRQFSEQLDAMGYLRMRAEEFHKLATTDPLTGLANRRTAEQRLAAEIARARRYGSTLTAVALDLDNFKQINDKYGHAAGDLVLHEFSRKLASTTRESDLAVRLGGDEFLLLLCNCPLEQVPVRLARLRPLEVSFEGIPIAIEFSAGCVGYEGTETPAQFLERADQTLYAQKRSRKAESKFGPALVQP
jgi:diguanylate cyclase (GGDEF)-like protein